jgi:nitrite reductase/ring-hydroxylating ferredoxin subunit
MKIKLIGIVLLAIAVSLVVAGCTDVGSSGKANASPVKATWITAEVSSDQVSIPLSSVEGNTNVHFKVNTNNGEIAAMAYEFNDEIFVRSNVCPPCNSIGFSLDDGTLVCDSCGTVFDAETGTGIGGGCVSFPKESIPYTVSNGNVVMKVNDVVTAHEKTVEIN